MAGRTVALHRNCGRVRRMRVLAIESSCDESAVAVLDERRRPARARALQPGRAAPRLRRAWCRSSPRAITCGASCRWCARALAAPASGAARHRRGGLHRRSRADRGAPHRRGARPQPRLRLAGAGASACTTSRDTCWRRCWSPSRRPFRTWRCWSPAATRSSSRCPGSVRYRVLGASRDDAAGEAFDKTREASGPAVPGRPAARAARRARAPRARSSSRARCSIARASSSASRD